MCSKKTLNTKLYCDNTNGMRKVLTKKTKTNQAVSAQIRNRTINLKKVLRCCNVAGWILIVDHLHKNMLDGSVFGIWLVISKILAFSFLFWFFFFNFNICAKCFNVLSFYVLWLVIYMWFKINEMKKYSQFRVAFEYYKDYKIIIFLFLTHTQTYNGLLIDFGNES